MEQVITLNGEEHLGGGLITGVPPHFVKDSMWLWGMSKMNSRYHAIVYCDPGTTPGVPFHPPPAPVAPPHLAPPPVPITPEPPLDIQRRGSPESDARRRAAEKAREEHRAKLGGKKTRECIKYDILFTITTTQLWALEYDKVDSTEPAGNFTWAEYLQGLNVALTLLAPGLQSLTGQLTGAATTLLGGLGTVLGSGALQGLMTSMLSGDFPTGKTPKDEARARSIFMNTISGSLQNVGVIASGGGWAPRDPTMSKVREVWGLVGVTYVIGTGEPTFVHITPTTVPCSSDQAMGSPNVCNSLALDQLPESLVPPPAAPVTASLRSNIAPGGFGSTYPVDIGFRVPKIIG
jgi:hypothetical protein